MLLFSGRAECIHTCGERVIRSVNAEHPMPTVIRFLNGGHKYLTRNGMTRNALHKRDGGRCAYCLDVVAKGKMTKDHVIPRCQNGRDTWENVVLACYACNNRKGGRTPAQAGMRLRIKPHAPRTAFLKGKHHDDWQPYIFC